MSTPNSKDDLKAAHAQYAGPLRAYVLKLVRDPFEAEDLVQETFVRALRRRETLRDPARMSTWLYTIATNLCRDHFRKRSRTPRTMPLDEERAESTGTPRLDLLLEREEMSHCVRGYLEALPDHYRAIILLKDVEGMSNPEIARMLGTSTGNVKIRLHRARHQLRTKLAEGCDLSRSEDDILSCSPKETRR